MTTPAAILIVDDDEPIRSGLFSLLSRVGFEVVQADNGAAALAAIETRPPDLVILDVVLNESDARAMNGLDVLRRIRALERFIPVIMLTSYAEWQVESLGQGAIAFVMKPWDTNALIGQIRATLNAVSRIQQDAARTQESQNMLLCVGDVQIDTVHFRVTRKGAEIDLTPLEFALLAFMARHPRREWTREQLLDRVWGYEWVGYPRTVDRHVASLRRKLKLLHDELIETVHQVGYLLNP